VLTDGVDLNERHGLNPAEVYFGRKPSSNVDDCFAPRLWDNSESDFVWWAGREFSHIFLLCEAKRARNWKQPQTPQSFRTSPPGASVHQGRIELGLSHVKLPGAVEKIGPLGSALPSVGSEANPCSARIHGPLGSCAATVPPLGRRRRIQGVLELWGGQSSSTRDRGINKALLRRARRPTLHSLSF
jgi:hypothetical protein